MIHIVKRLLITFVLRKNHATHSVGVGISLVKFDDFVQVAQRLDAITHLHLQLRTIEIGSRFVGEELDEVIEAAVGTSVVLFQGIRHGQTSQKNLVLGLYTQTLLEVGYCSVILLQILTSNATHLPSGDKEWIALNTSRSVLGSAQVIVQINLGYASIEVRVSQIGLDGNNLIEILYRQHIVLEVKGIAADGQHTVRVYLGRQ